MNPKRFLRHIAKASRISDDQDLVLDEVKKLESRVGRVLQNENLLLYSNQESVSSLKDQLKHLEGDISSLQKNDSFLVDMLKKKVNELESEIKKSHRPVEDFEKLTKSVLELREKMKYFVDSRTERERKIEELELRIKEKVSVNYNEIVKIENLLRSMEDKYDLVKKEGIYDKTILEEFEDKLGSLRTRLLMKKSGMDLEKVPKIRMLPMKRPEFHLTVQQKPRHEMVFAPLPSIPKKREIMKHGGLPLIPPIKNKPKKLLPLPHLPKGFHSLKGMKHHDYKPCLFDKLKDWFRKH